MNKLVFFLLFTGLCLPAYNQTIKGLILDESTKKPVSFAAIYFSGSFAGTYSDSGGFFELDVTENRSMPLVISALGYYSVTISGFSADKYYRIYLKPKVFELSEVIVSAKGTARERRERKANIRFFRDEFIGITLNSRKCDILNENELVFKYSAKGDTIRAFSMRPLIIENRALGYKLSYDLEKFELSRLKGYFSFSGNIMFLKDLALGDKKPQVFENRRMSAYMGSRMQFMRELWNNNLDSSGFVISDTDNKKYSYDDLVYQRDTLTKHFRKSGLLNIAYFSKVPRTIFTVSKDSVAFTRNGNFDGSAIEWAGEMSRQRIADQLPYEYSPSKKK
jgi:hypothetical protein